MEYKVQTIRPDSGVGITTVTFETSEKNWRAIEKSRQWEEIKGLMNDLNLLTEREDERQADAEIRNELKTVLLDYVKSIVSAFTEGAFDTDKYAETLSVVLEKLLKLTEQKTLARMFE